MSLVPHFLEQLENTFEGDSHLLDNTMVLYGSAMGDPNLHNHKRCPLVLLGGEKSGLPQGGLHLKAPDGTPMANALLSAMHSLGMDDMESFGNSSGAFPFTAPPSTAMERSR